MKKTIAVFLAVLLAFSGVIGTYAATFSDTVSHWAEDSIEYMVDKGIVNGYPDGTFLPEQSVTRVEFIKMICETFGLSATTRISFSDVSSDQWFYPYVARAAAQGFLLNYGSSMDPTAILSRQEAAALLVRYLDLDPDAKADSSVYSDYSSIKSAYRDYVLQATYDGLFKGRDNNCFDPDAALKRSEALTILYRAAGSIYRDTVSGKDVGAADDNAVISVSGISVSDVKLDGRVIVTEGASGDAVVFDGCEIHELILRGTTNVTLSGCQVDSLIVDSSMSGYTMSVSVIDNTEIDSFTMQTAAEVELASRTKIGTLTVEADAKNSSVTGKGTISQAKIQAKGFTSEQIPAKYELSAGITATFGGASYSGISTTNVFSVQPKTYATSSSCYLTATSTVSGTLQCYFTTTSTAPTSAQFASYYNTASRKTSFKVSAKVSFDSSIETTTNVSEYPYVVVMITDTAGNAYQPVVVANQASSGFSGTPTVSTGTDSYDYLNSTPTISGNIYYYYTSSSTALTVSTFTSGYSNSNASLRGSVSVTANKQNSSKLLNASLVPTSSYPYIAIMLLLENGEYQPLLISRIGTNSSDSLALLGTGFYSMPTCAAYEDTTYGGYLSGYQVSFVPSYSGTVEYYFSKSSTTPTSAEFTTQLAQLKSSSSTSSLSYFTCGETTVSAYSTGTLNANMFVFMSGYEYVVLRLRTSSMTYTPLVVKLSVTSGTTTDLTGNGLVTTPTVSVGTDGNLTLNLRTQNSGVTVYWYLTNTASISSSDVFLGNWKNTPLTSTGGSVLATGLAQTISTGISASSSVAAANQYIAILVSAGSTLSGSTYQQKYYTPLVLPISNVTTGGTTASSNAVTGTPSYTTVQENSLAYVTITPTVTGTVYYAYANSSMSAAEVKLAAQLKSQSVSVTTAYSSQMLPLIGTASAYVAVVVEASNGTLYTPFLVPTSGTGTFGSGFITTPTFNYYTGVTFTPSVSGTVDYFITDEAGLDLNSIPFDLYMTINKGTSVNVYANQSGSIPVDIANYGKYLYVMLKDSSGTNYTPVCVTLK